MSTPTPDGYGDPTGVQPRPRLASMGARLGGLTIDWLLVSVPAAAIGAFTNGFTATHACKAYGICGPGVTMHMGTTTWHASGTVVVLQVLAGVAYSAYFVGTRGQTIGHRLAGVAVMDQFTGAPIGGRRAALRWLVMVLTGAVCTLGYWSPFFDSHRRGWHDKASGTVAIAFPQP